MAVLRGWNTEREVLDAFNVGDDERRTVVIEFATYEQEGYGDGSACVIFRQGSGLFSIEASHCSCNGLDDQWSPTSTTQEALRLMLDKGWKPAGSAGAAEALRRWLEPTDGDIALLARQVVAAKARLLEAQAKRRTKLVEKREELEKQLEEINAEISRTERV